MLVDLMCFYDCYAGLQGWHYFWAKCAEIAEFEVLRYPLWAIE